MFSHLVYLVQDLHRRSKAAEMYYTMVSDGMRPLPTDVSNECETLIRGLLEVQLENRTSLQVLMYCAATCRYGSFICNICQLTMCLR